MISLDLDISYLASRYHIASSNIQLYKKKNMTIEQIMEAEAAKGNNKAAEMMLELTSNPDALAHLLQLVNPINRYLILMHMNKQDILMIIPFLEPEEMVLGLSIFNQDVLLDLMMKIEPEALSKVVLSKMEPDKFLKIIPEKFLDQFLTSDKIDRSMLMQAMEGIDEEQLQKMMENYTGESCYESKENILMQMGNMPDDNFLKSVLMFEPEGKQQLISGLLNEKPELFEEFSPEAMVFPFRTMQKEEILKSLTVLETKDMIPMVEDMSSDILSLITAQIDPRVFSKILCSEFSDVIAKCGLKM